MPFTSKVFLVRPSRFGVNPQTAASNAFQKTPDLGPDEISRRAGGEFEGLVAKLEGLGVEVLIVDDPPEPHTPDAVFPNNWFSTHLDGTLCLYPMESEIRRAERHPGHIKTIRKAFGTERVIDLSPEALKGRFLEGTGSLVIDHGTKTAYACVSSRTDPTLAKDWADLTGHKLVLFRAEGADGTPVYHTNVLMCIGNGFAVVCLDSIRDTEERRTVIAELESSGKEIIPISLSQMESFAGNMLQLETFSGAPLLVMSETAERSLTEEQREAISIHTSTASFAIPTIEACGGGSVRCMIAELF